ncbi:MAG: DUF4430 domain-containing protein [Actinomycetota bacterium]|nr:DUF4430 domain-containing protein [Actinomycetota bacterium]
MYRRSLALFAVAAAAAAVVPAALAVRVHVRVEGKTQTIFGASGPLLDVKDHVLDALETASLTGEFYYHLAPGPYVDQIGRYAAAGNSGWVFKVNGKSPPVAANNIHLRAGDDILWYWATFSGPSGPPTLELTVARAAKTCFHAVAVDDAGHRARTQNVVYTLNGRRVSSRSGALCTRSKRYSVRVAKTGAVRSKVYTRR